MVGKKKEKPAKKKIKKMDNMKVKPKKRVKTTSTERASKKIGEISKLQQRKLLHKIELVWRKTLPPSVKELQRLSVLMATSDNKDLLATLRFNHQKVLTEKKVCYFCKFLLYSTAARNEPMYDTVYLFLGFLASKKRPNIKMWMF